MKINDGAEEMRKTARKLFWQARMIESKNGSENNSIRVFEDALEILEKLCDISCDEAIEYYFKEDMDIFEMKGTVVEAKAFIKGMTDALNFAITILSQEKSNLNREDLINHIKNISVRSRCTLEFMQTFHNHHAEFGCRMPSKTY